MHDITQIRAHFPVPQPPGARETHCVGGAVCYYRLSWQRIAIQPGSGFPSRLLLSKSLRILNPALTLARAKRVAAVIIAANDRHDYGVAWDAADEALTYPFRQAIPSSC